MHLDYNETDMTLDCALVISKHLERNMSKYSSNPQMASKLANMNEYIRSNFINKLI